jgi:hypothetical protein
MDHLRQGHHFANITGGHHGFEIPGRNREDFTHSVEKIKEKKSHTHLHQSDGIPGTHAAHNLDKNVEAGSSTVTLHFHASRVAPRYVYVPSSAYYWRWCLLV